jgi:hypothetical protein
MSPSSANHQPNDPRLALWLRSRRSGTRTCCAHRFPGRVVVAPTGARDPEAEGLEVFFGAQAHRVVANPSLRFGLPPFAILAQTPIRRWHNWLPFQGERPPRCHPIVISPHRGVSLRSLLVCNVCASHSAGHRPLYGASFPQRRGQVASEAGTDGENRKTVALWAFLSK